MRTLTNILIVLVLATMAFLDYSQEQDIHSMKFNIFAVRRGLVTSHNITMYNYHRIEGGLAPANGGLAPANGGLGTRAGGLAPANGGSASWLYDLRRAAAIVNVRKQVWDGPISVEKKSGGTGTFVSDNVVLTSKHVVEDRVSDGAVTIVTESGEEFVAVAVLEDRNDDMALVEIVGRIGPYMEVGPLPSLGDKLILIGSPFAPGSNRQLTISWGRVSREKYKKDFLYDAFAWHGYSGGPAIAHGKVVGVIRARLTNTCGLGFAVPVFRLDPDLRARF